MFLLGDIYDESVPIRTNIRYFVIFEDFDGRAEGRTEFYGNQALIFDYACGDKPPVYKRYLIAEPQLERLLESVFSAESAGGT